MHLWFCPARQWSKRALSVFLALALSPLRWLWHCWNNREQREARGGQLVPAEGGVDRMGCEGVWTCPSHGWSDSPCAGLHIWKTSCRREGGVNANEQEERRCYICTSSSQRGQGVIFKTLCDGTGVVVRLSLILNCILEKGTTTFWT